MYTYKTVIWPNNKQKTKLKLILNKCIECQNIVYDYLDNHLKLSKENKERNGSYLPFPKMKDVRRWFTLQKKIKDDEVIILRQSMTSKEQREKHLYFLFSDCTNDALKQMVKDTYKAFTKFLSGKTEYPVRKSYKDIHKSFYVDPIKIKFNETHVKLEKIANNTKRNRLVLNLVKLAERNRIPFNKECKYYNPRISFDGYRFYLSVGVSNEYAPLKYKQKMEKLEKVDESIGVDLNVNNIVTSNTNATITKSINSINKDEKVNKIGKRFYRCQRSLSHKYIISKKLNNNKFIRTKNYIKQKHKLHLLRERLQNIKDNYLLEIINNIIFIKTSEETFVLPKRIVIEDLDVKSMQDTKKGKETEYLRPLLQQVSFGKILTKIKEKSEFYNIELIEADRYYASSKTCSLCKNIKEDLKLSDRIYKCDKCGLIIDRDLNAAINLANYNN